MNGFVEKKAKKLSHGALAFALLLLLVSVFLLALGGLTLYASFDNSDFPIAIGLLAVGAVMFLLGFLLLRRALKARGAPYRFISSYGSSEKTELIAAEINAVYKNNQFRHQFIEKNANIELYLSDHYLMLWKKKSIELVDLSHVLWVYSAVDGGLFQKKEEANLRFQLYFEPINGHRLPPYTLQLAEREDSLTLLQLLREYPFPVGNDADADDVQRAKLAKKDYDSFEAALIERHTQLAALRDEAEQEEQLREEFTAPAATQEELTLPTLTKDEPEQKQVEAEEVGAQETAQDKPAEAESTLLSSFLEHAEAMNEESSQSES